MTRLQEFLNSNVREVAAMGKRPRAGDLFGIELECEGKKVNGGNNQIPLEVVAAWAPHHDGSLRENHGSACEWVFNGPVGYEEAIARVNTLFDFFETINAKLVCSNRTSTHVHFNMADKKVYQLVNMYILFTILEDLFDEYCGEDRNGNLFCLSSRHAEQQLRWIYRACFEEHVIAYAQDMRYTSLNLAAINKFGTVEFRGMRGLDNREDLLNWLKIIKEFCDYSCYTMTNPIRVIEEISLKGPVGFLQDVFTRESLRELTKNREVESINNSVFEGLRLVQMLAYRIGTEFDGVKVTGKDFWASFAEKAPAVLDVDPNEIEVIAAPEPAPRRWGRGVPNPFVLPPAPQAEVLPENMFNRIRVLDEQQHINNAQNIFEAFRNIQEEENDVGF